MTEDRNFLDGYKKLSKTTMDPHMEQQIWNRIESEFKSKLTSSNKLPSRRRSVVGSLIAACVAVAVVVVSGGTYVLHHSSSSTTTQQPKNQVTQPYPVFSPPINMKQTFSIPSNDGHLQVVGYGDPTDSDIYARKLYVLTNSSGSTARVLYYLDVSNDMINRNQLFWFGKGSMKYLAFIEDVSITPEEAGGKLVIEQFSHSNTGAWQVTPQTISAVPGGEAYKLDSTHLLFESSGLGIQTPVQYAFSQYGVSHQPVTEEHPRQGEIANSITRTIHVTGTPAYGGTINYEITGDFSTLHMKVGQKLVIQVVYNVKPQLPLGVLMYPDVGDPGPGGLANYDASPYIDAKVFTLVHTAKHGQVVIFPEVIQGVKLGPKTPTGIIKIPIVVQK